MTPAEKRLWVVLRTEAFKPFHLRRQAPIGVWYADFLSRRARLVIEIDGDTHTPEKDQYRDACLLDLGFETIRFGNAEVTRNTDGIAQRILTELSLRFTPSAN